MDTATQEINFFLLTIYLMGGLAIFLYGMDLMSNALKMVAGDGMKKILATLTTNRLMGLLTGTFVTAIIQSSSVTTVMLVGFVSAGLMSLTQAVGVILGADIGTTITTQIVAFKVTKYASLFITAGFLMIFLGKTENLRHYGKLTLGLGMIFFGMGEMSDAMRPLRDYQPFLDMMQNVSNPLVGIAVATLFTGLVQSSSATMGVVVVLAMQGLIDLEGGIALALGANVGTCVTAGLAAIGKPREAVRVAVAHVTFKVAGVLLFVWFIPPFAEFIRSISPTAEANVTDMRAILAAEVPRQVANAHTLFNIGLATLFLPFTNLFVRFCNWVVPEKATKKKALNKDTGLPPVYRPQYLEDSLLNTPAVAIGLVRREVTVMSDLLHTMVDDVLGATIEGNMKRMKQLRKQDDRVDEIYHGITRYLSKLGRQNLSSTVANDVLASTTVTMELEHIGDLIENNFYHLAEVCAKDGITLSKEEASTLKKYHKTVLQALETAISAYVNDDSRQASQVINMKSKVMKMDRHYRIRQILALRETDTASELASFTLKTDICENLKRVFYYAKRIAKVVEESENHQTDWKAPAIHRRSELIPSA